MAGLPEGTRTGGRLPAGVVGRKTRAPLRHLRHPAAAAVAAEHTAAGHTVAAAEDDGRLMRLRKAMVHLDHPAAGVGVGVAATAAVAAAENASSTVAAVDNSVRPRRLQMEEEA